MRLTRRTLIAGLPCYAAGCSGVSDASRTADGIPAVLAFMATWTKDSDATLRRNARTLEVAEGFEVLDGTEMSPRLLMWITGSRKAQQFSIRAMKGDLNVVLLMRNGTSTSNVDDVRIASILMKKLIYHDILYMFQ